MQHIFVTEMYGSDFTNEKELKALLKIEIPEEDDFEVTIEITLHDIECTYYNGSSCNIDGCEEGYVIDSCTYTIYLIDNGNRNPIEYLLTDTEKLTLVEDAKYSALSALKKGYYDNY